MANRYAPYKSKYLAREPKTLVLKWTDTGTNGAQTLAATPFNQGVVSVVSSATGIYKVSLGSTATSRDTYSHFAGMDFVSTAADRAVDEVTNSACNHATDPNITFSVHEPSSGDPEYVGNGETVWVRLYFLDSTD